MGQKLLSKARKHEYNLANIKELPLALRLPIARFKDSKRLFCNFNGIA